MDERVNFVNKEMASLKVKVVKLTQEWDASVGRAEQLSLEVLCGPGLAEEAKKLCEGLSAHETSARPEVLKGSRLPATRLKEKKADSEAEMGQAHMKLDI